MDLDKLVTVGACVFIVMAMEVVDGKHEGQNQGWLVACQEIPEHFLSNTQSHRLRMVMSELVGLPGKALARDAARRIWFVVYAADWLHSMVLPGSSVVVVLLSVDGRGSHEYNTWMKPFCDSQVVFTKIMACRIHQKS